MTTSDWIQLLVGIVLLLTLIAVLWYAWEARRAARATESLVKYAQLNHAAENQPVVLPRLGYQTWYRHQEFAVTLQNFGRGPAVNLALGIQVLDEQQPGRRIYEWEAIDVDDRGRNIEEPVVASEPVDWPFDRPIAPGEKLELLYRISTGTREHLEQANGAIGLLELAYDDINGYASRITVELLLDNRHRYLRFGSFKHDTALAERVTKRSNS